MDKDRMDERAGDPSFIPGVFNYCDRWCERCPFTARCLNYAMGQEEFGTLKTQDLDRQAFWDKLHETFETTMEMLGEETEEMDFELDEQELQESIREQEEVHEAAEAQPYSRIAMRYIEVANDWFKTNEGLLGDESGEPESFSRTDNSGVEPVEDAAGLHDCLEVIRWYQHQIYVKLCRAASGTIRGQLEDMEEYTQEDADGSAKVALLGIERSIAAWAILLRHFPDHEDAILALGTLKRLLRQVEAAFPNARAFRRPGFDTDGSQ
jgi:hypothetical protein